MLDRAVPPTAPKQGVYRDRTEADLQPRFVKGEPPSDAAAADGRWARGP